MGFLTAGKDARRGLLHDARPDQPNRPPYTDRPVIRLAGLRHLGKYAKADPDLMLDLALHHVVPWRVLRDFWNALARSGWHEPLRDVAALFNRPKAQTKYWPEDMANAKFWDRGGTDDFAQNLCWWPWNLVRGPKHRSSADTDPGVAGTDPGEAGADPATALDDLSRGTGKNAVHLLAMLQVGRQMARVVRGADGVDPGQLSRDIAGWQTLARHPLVEFEPAAWRIEMGSPDFTPSVNNKPPVHPRWNKRTRADG